MPKKLANSKKLPSAIFSLDLFLKSKKIEGGKDRIGRQCLQKFPSGHKKRVWNDFYLPETNIISRRNCC